MKAIQKIAIVYLIAIGFMVWGIIVGKYQVFPYQILKEVQDFIQGHPLGEDTSVIDKIVNDIGFIPRRYQTTYPLNAEEGTHFIEVPDLKSRRDKPLVFISADHQSGYRAIFGAFDFENAFWGGILLSPTGEILHTWKLSTDFLTTSTVKDQLKILYGLHLFPDGSIIFTLQESGGGIFKVDG